MVDEERTRPGHWLQLVLCLLFRALMLVEWKKGHLASKNPISLIPRRSLPEWVEEDPHTAHPGSHRKTAVKWK